MKTSNSNKHVIFWEVNNSFCFALENNWFEIHLNDPHFLVFIGSDTDR